MENLGPFLYLLLFAVFVLLNYVMRQLAKRQKGQSGVAEEESPAPEDVRSRAGELTRRADEVTRRLLEERMRRREQVQQRRQLPQQPGEVGPRLRPAERLSRVRAVAEEPEEVLKARARAARAEAHAVSGFHAPGRHDLRALLANRRNLRQAIVLMTVLGPCRALEDRAEAREPRQTGSG